MEKGTKTHAARRIALDLDTLAVLAEHRVRLEARAAACRLPFHTIDDLELATCCWVYWFNTNRSHSSIGYATTIEHENAYYHHNNPDQHQLTGEPSLN